MTGRREFSEEFLRDAGVLTVDMIDRALHNNNPLEAQQLLERFQQELSTMFFNYRSWEKGILREIVARENEASASAALQSIENRDIAPERIVAGKEIIGVWQQSVDNISANIKAERFQNASEDCKHLFKEGLQQHDGMMSRITALLTLLHKQYGTDVVQKVLQESMSADAMDPDGSLPFREKVLKIILFVRVHLTPFTLTEDDEKATFMPDPCPSGGRLIREGHYQEPRNGAIVREPGDITWQRNDLPIYCCHEPAMEQSSIQKTGVPVFLVEPSAELGKIPCKTYIYKNPKDIPERFFERVGLNKADSLIASDRR